MRLRARHIHLIEVTADTFMALFINASISYWYLNTFAGGVTVDKQIGLTAVLTVLSLIRKYIFRRVSSEYIRRLYAKASL